MGHFCSNIYRICKTFSCKTALFIRTFHVLLSIGIPATLLIKPSVLQRAIIKQEDIVYGGCYVGLLLLSLVMYFLACFIDPGYVPKINVKPSERSESIDSKDSSDDEFDFNEKSTMLKMDNIADSSIAGIVKQKRCHVCGIEQPMRAKHCEDCKKCVYKWDHHCPWLETCIGERNHRYFWLFLVFKTALIIWTLYIAWEAIENAVTWREWTSKNILYCIDILILVLAGFSVAGLCLFHTYLMFGNTTTWELVSRSRISYLKYLDSDFNPFNEGYCKNMCTFLCHCKLRPWAYIYTKNQTSCSSPSGMV